MGAGDWTLTLAGGVAGLFLGSFLNVCALYLAGGPSPWRARSACPLCGHGLAWRDLAPVVSFLALGGRCRSCQGPISPLYPAGELACALVCAFWLHQGGLSWITGAWIFFSLVLVMAGLADWASGLVPDLLVLPALGLALGLSPWLPGPGLIGALVGAAAVGGGLLLVALAYRRLRGREGLGMGDVKLGLFLGALLGWPQAGLAVTAGAAATLAFYGLLALFRRVSWQAPVPLAPFLALGALTGLAAGHL